MDDKYVDMINKIDPTLIYITTNQPIQNKNNEIEDGINHTCSCEINCLKQCNCTQKSGICYTPEGLLNIISNKPAFECNHLCKCSLNCGNRIVSKGPNQNLIIKQIENKNYGLFTTSYIPMGSFICEYAGEIIDSEEAKNRFMLYRSKRICNYIFWLRESPEYESNNPKDKENEKNYKGTETIIDPTVVGNIGRFINHSCEPNCMIVPIRIDSIYPKLCIFTQKNVAVNEEINFDYGYNSMLECRENKDDIMDRIVCHCNSLHCKKFLPFHGSY